jgi:hypothetical protein
MIMHHAPGRGVGTPETTEGMTRKWSGAGSGVMRFRVRVDYARVLTPAHPGALLALAALSALIQLISPQTVLYTVDFLIIPFLP